MHNFLTTEQLTAVVDAIKGGVWAKDSPLSLREFTAIHEAVVLINRKWAIELVTTARQEFKQQVEALAMRTP